MFYIATNNHYLFVGLDSLLKPYKSKKIRTIKRNNPKHLNFSAGDTIFFDDSIDVVCLLEGMVVNNLSLNIICMHSCESPANFIINPIELLSKDFTSMNIKKFPFLKNEKNCGFFKRVVLSPRYVVFLNYSIKETTGKTFA
ncbi:hypothetical protein, partial [Klebsiella pneumoniae]|uniref:hypothetical protein n=1 Tax=Klebsiella pneumoniae TaxID=573 RepID=UPI0013B05B17